MKKRKLRPGIRLAIDAIELAFVIGMSGYMIIRIILWGIGL